MDPGDPNYITVKNSLGTAIQDLLAKGRVRPSLYVTAMANFPRTP
jgi:hypothetical protein